LEILKFGMTRCSLVLGLLLALGNLIHASNITDKVFADIKEGIVAAFGDFNSDELTDVFVIRDGMKRLQILFGMLLEPGKSISKGLIVCFT